MERRRSLNSSFSLSPFFEEKETRAGSLSLQKQGRKQLKGNQHKYFPPTLKKKKKAMAAVATERTQRK